MPAELRAVPARVAVFSPVPGLDGEQLEGRDQTFSSVPSTWPGFALHKDLLE